MVRHLYIHIPFCHRICPYCSFYKHKPGSTDIPAFLESIVQEARAAASDHRGQIQTVYLGGGTPSALSRAQFEHFLPRLKEALDLSTLQEFTLEANPKTFDQAKASLWRDLGVTRVSLGVQSWDSAILHTLGRDHSAKEAKEAFHTLRAVDFPVVSIDLMFSIPGQSLDTWVSTLNQTIALNPDHVSGYNLNYEEDTEFFERLTSGEFHEDEQTDAAFFTRAHDLLAAAKFEQYEISNYARPGFESLHNQAYWQGNDYLGLGPSAVSTINGVRTKNVPDTARYVSQVTSGHSATHETEVLDAEMIRCERIALGLRTRQGLEVAVLGPTGDRLEDLETEGLIEMTGNRFRLTPKGRLVADTIATHLL